MKRIALILAIGAVATGTFVDREEVPAATHHESGQSVSQPAIPPATVVPDAARGSLVLTEKLDTRRGPLERYEQRVDGLRVLGGEVVLRRDHDGKVVWEDGEPRDVRAIDFRLTAEEAAETVNTDRVALSTEPLVWAVGNRKPRAAYRIVFAPSADRRTQERVTVDASSGALLGRENLVHSARGHVYEVDPLTTPDLIEVELPTTGPALSNDRFHMGNCRDAKTCTDVYPSMCRTGCTRSNPRQMNEQEVFAIIDLANTASLAELDNAVALDARAARNIVDRREQIGPFGTIEELDAVSYVAETAFGKMLSYAYDNGRVLDTQLHFCDMTSNALPDSGGDYYFSPAAGSDGTDAFVEVQLFHHLNLVDDIVRSWGFGGLGQQIQVVGNYRDADEYDPMSRQCADGVFIGEQELALVENAWFAPSQLAGDPALVFGQGADVDWGLDADIVYHEYGHAVMYAVAPDVGNGTWDDYGFNRGQAGLHEGYADLLALWLSDGEPKLAEYVASSWGDDALRDWSKPARCPDDMTGEEHDDGLILPSALWHAREAISPEARPDFDESAFIVWQSLGANDGLVSAVGRIIDEFDSVRPSEADVARDVLNEFFVDDCLSRTVDAWTSRDLAIQGNDYYDVAPYGVPHTLQWRATLTGAATEFTFATTNVDPVDPANPTDMTVFMKYGNDPIQWRDDEAGYINDAEVQASVQVTDGVAITTLSGDFQPGTYTFALANRGGSAYLWGTSIDTNGVGEKDDSSIASFDEDDGGCATGTGPVTLAPLLVLLGFLRRR